MYAIKIKNNYSEETILRKEKERKKKVKKRERTENIIKKEPKERKWSTDKVNLEYIPGHAQFYAHFTVFLQKKNNARP